MQLNDLTTKARELLDKAVTRQIKVYDSSKTKIIVSGLTLDGVTSATISAQKVGEGSSSTSQNYFSFYDTYEDTTLEVNLLPTAKAVDALYGLSVSQRLYKGYCKVLIIENGEPIGNFVGYIQNTPQHSLEKEAGDRAFSFLLKTPTISTNSIRTFEQSPEDTSDERDVTETVIN